MSDSDFQSQLTLGPRSYIDLDPVPSAERALALKHRASGPFASMTSSDLSAGYFHSGTLGLIGILSQAPQGEPETLPLGGRGKRKWKKKGRGQKGGRAGRRSPRKLWLTVRSWALDNQVRGLPFDCSCFWPLICTGSFCLIQGLPLVSNP